MNRDIVYKISTYFIASIWFINGLICKVFAFVPRHEQIVGRIIGEEYSHPLTILIGISEILMSIWIITNYKPKLNVSLQIAIIALMNILEFVLVPDLLLWGS